MTSRARAGLARLLSWLAPLALALVFAGCSNGGGGGSPPPALAITAQPADVSVTAGQPASFHAGANLPADFQWQRNDGSAWTAVAGATSDTYTIASPQVSDNGAKLRVVVTSASNGAASLTSSAATLSVVAGADATFSVTASGTAITYQWQRSPDGSAWNDVGGGTAATLAVAGVTLADDGARFRVVVTNALGSATSAAAQLHVTPAPVAPTFSAMPGDLTVVAPQSATFSVAVSGTPAPTLAWQVSADGMQWTTMAGETGSSLVLPSVSLADSGKRFRAVASNASGQVESAAALLTVTPQPVAAFITTSPADTSVGIGATPTFHVAAGGTPTPALQWQVSSDGGTTFVNVTGATAADLTLPAVTSADDGKRVRAVATNATGSATSASARLTVRPAPHITQQPESQAWRTGLPSPQFTVAGAGSGLSFKWQMRASGALAFSDIAGATGSTVTVTPPAGGDAEVRAVVTNAAGDSATSDAAALTHLLWTYLSPQPTGDEMFADRWIDATTALAVGGKGTVIRTTDAGLSWSVVEEADVSRAQTLLGLAVSPSGQTAVAVGMQGIVRRSADGGLHWLTTHAAVANAATLSAVSFADAATVVVGNGDGSMLRSTDAGLTWTVVGLGQTDPVEAIEFRAGVGIAVTQHGTVLRSINGGAQWSAVQTNFGVFNHKITFASDSVVIVALAQSVGRSTDAGLTWQNVPVDTYFLPGDVAFTDPLHGVELPSSDGAPAYATSDGGLTWPATSSWPFASSSTGLVRFSSLRFNSNGVGLAVGYAGTLMRTPDGGQTWAQVDASIIPHHDSILDAAFVTPSHGAAVSTTQLYTTSDAGAHWARVAAGDHSATGSNTWTAVRAVDATHLLAIDTQGNLLGSNDAGATWSARGSTRAIQYNGGMAFADASFGYVVTGDGYIQRTTDGGATWVTVYTPPGFYCLTDVSAPNRSVAVAAGCAGDLLRTIDGGATWTAVTSTVNSPTAVTFADANTAIATGSKVFSGTTAHMFRRTRDGGATWQDVAVPSTSANFGKAWFVSATEGFVAGNMEYWHTIDGGATWTLEAINWDAWNGVALDARTSLVFGGFGSVVRRSN